ncbi:hypothetical protein KDI_49970 [Dictyobacter arantiisoli]|uniref:Uncharacterized protein n=1 Tax=Dictyobacter arantiisoli TaxID=2014874 RepID=A0A5A5TK84_9CHLR|nr:hypothetical protein KDI_49970 [Dictyobacter arantiisoli]
MHSNRDFAWLHLAFLLAVTLVPFSTAFLARYIQYHVAVIIYWLTIVLLGMVLLMSWRYARHARLVKDEMTADAHAAIEKEGIALER